MCSHRVLRFDIGLFYYSRNPPIAYPPDMVNANQPEQGGMPAGQSQVVSAIFGFSDEFDVIIKNRAIG
jgi:hypothetical protein